jgi:predicted transcriptional regulator
LRKILARKNVRDLPITPPLQLIQGLLYQGGKISFSAPPKLFKTWNLLHLFFCLANGLEYLGFKTVRVPIVLFDLELIEYDIRFRLEEIARFYNLPGDWSANLHIIPLRGQPVDFGNAITQEIVIETVKGAAAGAFGIDPLYKALTGYDENSNSDIAQVLKPFEQLTRECRAAFAYNQHFSKGNQSAKDPLDRIAGAGAFSRDPDALLTFTKHREDHCFTVDVIQWSFPPIPAFVVRWQYPVLIRDTTGLDPADLEIPQKAKGQAKKSEVQKREIMNAVVAAEPSGGITYSRLLKITGIPETSFRRHLKELVAAGEIYKSVANSNYQLTPKNAQKWGNVI